MIPHPIELPKDWRQFHLENVAKLDRAKVEACVVFIQKNVIPDEMPSEIEDFRAAAEVNPTWWTADHHHWMMEVRNALRRAGFGEKEFGIQNLDDYAVGLVELALGITKIA